MKSQQYVLYSKRFWDIFIVIMTWYRVRVQTQWRRVSNIFPLNIDDWVTSSKLLTKLSSLVDWLFNTCLTNFIISNTYFLLSGKLSVNIFLRLLFNINMVLFKAHFSYECQSEWKAQKKLPSTLETQIKYRRYPILNVAISLRKV